MNREALTDLLTERRDLLPSLSEIRLERMRRDPSLVLDYAGLDPDPWQRQVLRSTTPQRAELISRQGGKSTTTGGRGYHRAVVKNDQLVLLLSPSLRQSGELFRKVLAFHNKVGVMDAVQQSALSIEFTNGSRILALPGKEETVRGYSAVDELIIDEAARVQDALYYMVRPMLAVSQGSITLLTTPFGKRGFFYKEWTTNAHLWEQFLVTAHDIPRIDPEWLAAEKALIGDLWFRQEYECKFIETEEQLFSYELLQAALIDEVEPLFASELTDEDLLVMEEIKKGEFSEGFSLD